MSEYVRGHRAKMMLYDNDVTFDTETLNEIIKPFMKKRVATGCLLCDKIWSSKEAYQDFVGDHWEEKIVIAMEDDEPYLYVPIEMDDYYSDTVMQINYCPKCGRKLI